jgi:hypothetical protein
MFLFSLDYGSGYGSIGGMEDTRHIGLKMAKGNANDKMILASVTFCESSASLQINGITVHIPWSELAIWQAWLAQRVEEEY